MLYPGVSEQWDYLPNNRLTATLGENSHAFMFGGGIEMDTASFLMLSDVLTTAKLRFERRHTLVGYFAWEYVANSITPDVSGAKFVIKEVLYVSETVTHTLIRGDNILGRTLLQLHPPEVLLVYI